MPVDPSASGMELLLSDVPYGMSQRDLKKELAAKCKQYFKCNFQVVFTKYVEDLFWDSLAGGKVTNTARISLPDINSMHRPGQILLDKGQISIHYQGKERLLLVRPAPTQETTNDIYGELRKEELDLLDAVQDGVLGEVRSISLGNFDSNRTFETTHTWTPSANSSKFNKFSYYGDAFPKKFQICLTNSAESDPCPEKDSKLAWEWMDVHESNILGIVFVSPITSDQRSRMVYFVLDKPPQFYQRVRERKADSGNRAPSYVHTRISHPSFAGKATHYDKNICDVAGIPWFIQYSRVLKIHFDERQEFSLESYKHRLSQTQRDAMVLCNPSRFIIQQSNRTVDDMISTLHNNVIEIRNSRHLYRHCQIAALKLYYNGNICPLQEEATSTREMLAMEFTSFEAFWSSMGEPERSRRLNAAFKTSAEHMGKAQHRALWHLDANSPIPLKSAPGTALAQHIGAICMDVSAFVHRAPDRLGPPPPEAFQVLVYPSHTEIRGPVAQTLNSVIEKYRDNIDRFFRIRFIDNNEKTFRREAGVDPDSIIDDRIVEMLRNREDMQPLLPIARELEFLGYSVSGLRKGNFYFLHSDQGNGFGARALLTATEIRDGIGRWDRNDNLAAPLAQHPSKWGARLALAFSDAYSTLDLRRGQWEERADVLVDGLASTDGCGLVSPAFCKEINQKLASRGYGTSQAFQIRFGGAKGVVYCGVQSLLDPPHSTTPGLKMLLRKSQVKFNTADTLETLALRVVSTSGTGYSSLFFGPVVKALEDSGVDTARIVDMYDREYRGLTAMSHRGLDSLQQICRVSDEASDKSVPGRYMLLRLAIRLKKRYDIVPEDYGLSFLKAYLVKLAERAREKNLFEIPIPNSYQVLGLTDDYQILEDKEVYVRAKGETRVGEVLIYRDPIIHIGDIQKATALTDGEIEERLLRQGCADSDQRLRALKSMDNVVFFSQRDNPPLPNRLAGGDLDGDRFEILAGCDMDLSWLQGFEASEHATYDEDIPQAAQDLAQDDFDVDQLARFVGQYIRNDCFFELQSLFMSLADDRKEGMKNVDVKALAKWLSQAVDYKKSGNKVDLYDDVFQKREFSVATKPDFIRGLNRKEFYEPRGEYYESPNTLGRIYRRISRLKYRIPRSIDEASLRNSLRAAVTGHRAFQDTERDPDGGGGWFAKEITNELVRYRQYLQARGVTEHAEVDVFFRRKLDGDDDFPETQLRSLASLAMESLLARRLVVRRGPRAAGESTVPRASSAHRYEVCRSRREVVERHYRRYLFEAW